MRQFEIGFADPRCTYTKSFDRYALELQGHMTIQDVATDMPPSYISAVSANMSETAIVFDHSHNIKMFNDKISQLPRDLQHEAKDADRSALKRTRWPRLENPKTLRPVHNEPQQLVAALHETKYALIG